MAQARIAAVRQWTISKRLEMVRLFGIYLDRIVMKGEVKWYNPEKGYGFIHLDDGNDVFVHHTDLAQKGFRIIWEGQRVSCDIEARPDNGKKKKALNVVVVDDHDWKTRYPKCPVCNGKGTRDNPNSMCHPCEGNGVLSMEGVYALYCSANAAAEFVNSIHSLEVTVAFLIFV